MADPVRIPCVLMRGGTSRAAFFLRSDLPAEPGSRDAVLIAAMGAGHELQVDGIGGGNPVTSKAAIVGPSSRPGADVDYLFAQVGIRERSVDLSPICGNILAAVGPFAIEAGLVPAGDGTTTVRVHNVNTGKIVEAEVVTPGRRVTYEGETAITRMSSSRCSTFHSHLGSSTVSNAAIKVSSMAFLCRERPSP